MIVLDIVDNPRGGHYHQYLTPSRGIDIVVAHTSLRVYIACAVIMQPSAHVPRHNDNIGRRDEKKQYMARFDFREFVRHMIVCRQRLVLKIDQRSFWLPIDTNLAMLAKGALHDTGVISRSSPWHVTIAKVAITNVIMSFKILTPKKRRCQRATNDSDVVPIGLPPW